MTKNFYTYFSTIFLVHVLVLMGTWQLSQSEYVRSQIDEGVLKLKVASSMISNQVQKKVERVVPVNPEKPRVSQKEEKVTPVVPVEEQVQASAEGSEFGTSVQGKTDILSLYKAELRAMIDKNKYYPPMSKRLGQTGTVVVAFTLLEDGHIIDVKIDTPSRYERLNESALEAVKKVERFKPIPKEIGEKRMEVKVPVKFITI